MLVAIDPIRDVHALSQIRLLLKGAAFTFLAETYTAMRIESIAVRRCVSRTAAIFTNERGARWCTIGVCVNR